MDKLVKLILLSSIVYSEGNYIIAYANIKIDYELIESIVENIVRYFVKILFSIDITYLLYYFMITSVNSILVIIIKKWSDFESRTRLYLTLW